MEFFEFLMRLTEWHFLVLFSMNLACVYVAVKKGFWRAVGVTGLIYLAFYLIFSIIAFFISLFMQPAAKKVLNFTSISLASTDSTPLQSTFPTEITPKLIIVFLVMMIVVGALHYAIEWAIMRFCYPNLDKRRLASFVLLAAFLSSSWYGLCVYVGGRTPSYKQENRKEAQEDEKRRFIDGLERGSIELKMDHKILKATFNEPFYTDFYEYKKGQTYYVEGTMQKHLQDIAKEYVKKPKRSR